MTVHCVWEHNGDDSMLYAADFPGAFTRGESKEIAIAKMEKEIISFLKWTNQEIPNRITVEIIQEKPSDLQICDADSDVIFDTERDPITREEYQRLKELALKSAECFQRLFDSVPDKNKSNAPARKTFYGAVPRTAREMYEHTKNVNAYYFGEIGVDADNEGTVVACRKHGFATLEANPDFLDLPVFDGSYGEAWSLRKVLRRFIWHDRIHAKAMYRMAIRTFGQNSVPNIFEFDL